MFLSGTVLSRQALPDLHLPCTSGLGLRKQVLVNTAKVSFLNRSDTLSREKSYISRVTQLSPKKSRIVTSMAIPVKTVDCTPMATASGPSRLMIVSDLDNTMVDHKDPKHSSLLRFNALWSAEYSHDSLLVFSTGRSPTKLQELKSHVPLLTPVIKLYFETDEACILMGCTKDISWPTSPGITICSVGTEILYGEKMVPDKGWEKLLNEGWNREIVVQEATKFTGLRWQGESEQRPHKVSFNVEKKEAAAIIEPLSARLNERGLKVKIIYSGGYDLDILPETAGKGLALAYLLRKLKGEGKSPLNTLACGDSGNDQELFTVEGANGVIVGNAMEELVQWYEGQTNTEHLFRATERCAAGIMQAMTHFGFHPSVSPRDLPLDASSPMAPAESSDRSASSPAECLSVTAAQREVVQANIVLEQWLNGELDHDILQGTPSILAEGFTLTLPSGKELSREEFSQQLGLGYGRQRGKGWKIWIDRMVTTELAPGLWLARFHACEQPAGGDRVVRICSAILRAKAGTPNGVEWVYLHETFQDGVGYVPESA